MNALLRRRVMIASGGSTPPTPVDPGDLSNYVQDGLVLHLDGKNKGGTSGRWTSLVGSTYYTLTTHSTEESDAIVMDGSGYITATSPVNVTYTSGTVEVCVELLNSNSCVIIYGPVNSIGCMFSTKTSFGVKSPGSSNTWNITGRPSLMTISMNSDLCYMNGLSVGTIDQDGWGAGTTHTIGGRDYGTNKYYANARIHSIRIYDRKLSASEMIKNQKVDNARFSLGLNI